MRSETGDISLVASLALILIALIVIIGGAVMIEIVHSEQFSAAISTPSSAISSASNSGIVITIESGSGANTTSIYYSPPQIVVIIGKNSTITWVNKDNAPHTVTSDISGAFNSGNMSPGASWSFTFNTTGTYDYHCSYHPWMHGTIVVKQG